MQPTTLILSCVLAVPSKQRGCTPGNRGFGSMLTRVSRQLPARWGLGWGLFFFFFFFPWKNFVKSHRTEKMSTVGGGGGNKWQNREISGFLWKLWRQSQELQKQPPSQCCRLGLLQCSSCHLWGSGFYRELLWRRWEGNENVKQPETNLF